MNRLKTTEWSVLDDPSSEDETSDNSDDYNETEFRDGFTKFDGVDENVFWQRKRFVKRCSLFKNWSSKMRHLCEARLRKEYFHFDAPIIKQGTRFQRLYFLIRGQCKLIVDKSNFATQKEHNKTVETEKISNKSRQLSNIRRTCINESVNVRRHAGYAAAERRLVLKNTTLCYVDEGDILGDVELVFDLDTYLHTAICTAKTEVLSLDISDLEQLLHKRNTTTMDQIREMATEKVRSRASMREGRHLNIYRQLENKLSETQRRPRPVSGKQEEGRPRSVLDTINDRGIMINQLSKMFVQDKVPFIEPSVPGSLFFLTKSAERAEKRRAITDSSSRQKRMAGSKTGEVRLQRARRRAQRQARSRRELERLTLGSESQDMKKLRDDDHAVNRYLAHNVGTKNITSSPLQEITVEDGTQLNEQDGNSDGDQVQLSYKDIAQGDLTQVVIDMGQKQQVSNANRAKIICSLIEKKANKQPSAIDQLTRPKSAPAPLRFDEPEEEEVESFDWETSDKALNQLEQKVRLFLSKYDGTEKANKASSQVTSLKRFTIQGPEDVPIPGGTVYVKQRTCEYSSLSHASEHHHHIRRYMIPKNAYRMAVRTLATVHMKEPTESLVLPKGPNLHNLKKRTQSAPSKRHPIH